jgi:adenylate cyclase
MVDVRALLAQVKVPTLIMHCRDDAVVPFSEGKLLADSIAGSRFVALEGRNHIILESEPAWERFVAEVRDFLGDDVPAAVGGPERQPQPGRTSRMLAAAGGPPVDTMAPASPERHGISGTGKPTIVVVPFKSKSTDPEHEIFADGVTEDLTTMLSRVLGLFVIARDSALHFRDRPSGATEAARGLGVRYALHGSVRMTADRIRVNAYLLDSHTGTEVWSERYDAPRRDVFAVQDEIATHVVRALQVELLEGEQARAWHRSTESIAAWSCLTQGLAQYKRQTKDGVQRARVLFERATELDPTYAAAWAWLAYAHWHDARFLWVNEPEKALMRATEIAGRALALDDKLPEVHGILGVICMLRREYDEAIAAARRAVALDPNGAEASAILAFVLTWAGQPEEAIRAAERAIKFCPLHSAWYLDTLAHAQHLLRQFDRAVVAYRQVIMRLPDYIMPHIGLAACYAEMGRLVEAREQAQEVLRIDPGFSIERHTRMSQYRLPEHTERRLRALRAAGLP